MTKSVVMLFRRGDDTLVLVTSGVWGRLKEGLEGKASFERFLKRVEGKLLLRILLPLRLDVEAWVELVLWDRACAAETPPRNETVGGC